MSTAVDTMIASFPNNRVEKSDEEPHYNLIKEIEKLLITIVTSTRSELGGGESTFVHRSNDVNNKMNFNRWS